MTQVKIALNTNDAQSAVNAVLAVQLKLEKIVAVCSIPMQPLTTNT